MKDSEPSLDERGIPAEELRLRAYTVQSRPIAIQGANQNSTASVEMDCIINDNKALGGQHQQIVLNFAFRHSICKRIASNFVPAKKAEYRCVLETCPARAGSSRISTPHFRCCFSAKSSRIQRTSSAQRSQAPSPTPF